MIKYTFNIIRSDFGTSVVWLFRIILLLFTTFVLNLYMTNIVTMLLYIIIVGYAFYPFMPTDTKMNYIIHDSEAKRKKCMVYKTHFAELFIIVAGVVEAIITYILYKRENVFLILLSYTFLFTAYEIYVIDLFGKYSNKKSLLINLFKIILVFTIWAANILIRPRLLRYSLIKNPWYIRIEEHSDVTYTNSINNSMPFIIASMIICFSVIVGSIALKLYSIKKARFNEYRNIHIYMNINKKKNNEM